MVKGEKIYIYFIFLLSNAGTNRALLCKASADGQNQVLQIGRPHTTENEDELQRLAALGEEIMEERINQCLLLLVLVEGMILFGRCESVSLVCLRRCGLSSYQAGRADFWPKQHEKTWRLQSQVEL